MTVQAQIGRLWLEMGDGEECGGTGYESPRDKWDRLGLEIEIEMEIQYL